MSTADENKVKANEEFYDKEIAPELARLAKLCKEKDMYFSATVFNHGDDYETSYTDNQQAKQRIVRYAIACAGNIDTLIKVLIKDAEEYGHSSIFIDILKKVAEGRYVFKG